VKVLEVYDDLAFARSQAKLLADVSCKITLEAKDARTGRMIKVSETFLLDLGEGNWQDVSKYLGELAEAGKLMQRQPGTQQGKSGNISRGRKENDKLHRWVRENQVMHRDDPTRMAHLTPSGKAYRPGWLWDMYDAAMEAKDGVGGAGPEQRQPDPGDRGRQG
jgi:hypothetical protein